MILPFLISLTEREIRDRSVINSIFGVKLRLMRGLITANLKVFGTYPNDNDELLIFRRGSITSGGTSFRSLNGTGSNIGWFRWFNKFIQFLISNWREWVELYLKGSIAYYLMRYCGWQLHGPSEKKKSIPSIRDERVQHYLYLYLYLLTIWIICICIRTRIGRGLTRKWAGF